MRGPDLLKAGNLRIELLLPIPQFVPIRGVPIDVNIIVFAREHPEYPEEGLIRQRVIPVRPAIRFIVALRVPRLLKPFVLPREQYRSCVAGPVNLLQ
ncbi:hypothetical protein D3C86_2044600 [compost metagenome]